MNYYEYGPTRFIKDIERCPFVPKETGYAEWNRKDKERLDKLEEEYQLLKKVSQDCLNGEFVYPKNLKKMAKFILEMIKD